MNAPAGRESILQVSEMGWRLGLGLPRSGCGRCGADAQPLPGPRGEQAEADTRPSDAEKIREWLQVAQDDEQAVVVQ
jgi:hypothetical protein